MRAAVVSEQGRRPEMEDAHYLDTDFGGRGWLFGGVYDGHGGAFAAEYAAKNLHRRFLEGLLAGKTPGESFIFCYETISEELKAQDLGTTAVTFLIKDSTIFTANAGDARAIVVGEQSQVQLSTDHRVDNPEEKERVTRMGGRIVYPYVYRDYAGLMPTRTIGDDFFKPVGIIARPSLSERRISPDDLMLVAACDGLFDFMTNEEVAEFVRRYSEPEELVNALAEEVLARRMGTDNLTIIAVSLK